MAKDYREILNNLGLEFGLPQDFLLNVLKEDDWSFIIKLHALIEAAVSQLLMHHIGDKRLLNIFELLELGNINTGKMAFIKSMELLTTKEQQYIKWLSKLRNRLVHKIENLNFNLISHIASLDHNQKRTFCLGVEHFLKPKVGQTQDELALLHPKVTIWYTAILLMAKIHGSITDARLRKEFIDEQIKALEEFAT